MFVEVFILISGSITLMSAYLWHCQMYIRGDYFYVVEPIFVTKMYVQFAMCMLRISWRKIRDEMRLVLRHLNYILSAFLFLL